MKKAFKKGDVFTALYILPYIKTDERCQLLNELVRLSASQSFYEPSHNIILSLPKEWLLSHIEEPVETILQDDATHIEYCLILELYMRLNYQLAYKLAQRAIEHIDEDIQEVGKRFLNILPQSFGENGLEQS